MKDLKFFGEKIDFFPKREIITFDYLAESKEALFERINVLNRMVKKESKIVITTIEAVMQKMITKENLYKYVMKLKNGDTISLNNLKERLVALRL